MSTGHTHARTPRVHVHVHVHRCHFCLQVQRLSDAKVAGMLQYSAAAYLRLAEAAAPPRA